MIPENLMGWRGVMGGAFIAFFAFIGFETLANLAEEARGDGDEADLATFAAALGVAREFSAHIEFLHVRLNAHHVQIDQPAIGVARFDLERCFVETFGELQVANLGCARRYAVLGSEVLLGVVVPDGVGGSFGSSVRADSTCR